MTSLLIGVPVLGRPQNAPPLVESIRATAPGAEVLFLASLFDHDQIEACLDLGEPADAVMVMPFEAGPGDFARKHNAGFEVAQARGHSLYFTGADDLRFRPGWLEALLACLAANPAAGVIGTNDLGNRQTVLGYHSTHSLVTRAYIEAEGGYVGGQGKVFWDGYDHQQVDCELVETAKARGRYAHCHQAVVEHLHPLWRKAKSDPTYERALARGREDRALFRSRQHLWENEKRAVA